MASAEELGELMDYDEDDKSIDMDTPLSPMDTMETLNNQQDPDSFDSEESDAQEGELVTSNRAVGPLNDSFDCEDKNTDGDSEQMRGVPHKPSADVAETSIHSDNVSSDSGEYSETKDSSYQSIDNIGNTHIKGLNELEQSSGGPQIAQSTNVTAGHGVGNVGSDDDGSEGLIDDESTGDILSEHDEVNTSQDVTVRHLQVSNAEENKTVANGAPSYSENKVSLDLRAPHDDHGELDYEEDVDDTFERKNDSSLLKDDSRNEKEDGEEDDEEDGEHISDDDTDGELEDDDDCEEGEIKDVGEKNDEEEGEDMDSMDPYSNQPICRFFMRGTCNWGISCRFLHPGVQTAGGFIEESRKPWNPESSGPGDKKVPPPAVPAAPVTETAWERGLRHAKELRKKSQKRKETEPDFEEKRKNLSINTSDIVEEETTKAPPSPEDDNNKENERDKIHRDPYYDGIFSDMDMHYNSKQPIEGWHGGGHYENFEVRWNREVPNAPPPHITSNMEPYPDFRIPERERMYKEKPHHKYRYGPGNERYDKRKDDKYKKYNKYQDFDMENMDKSRPSKDSGGGGGGHTRGEEWADPWQRAKSPVRRKHSSSRSRSRGRRHSRSGSRSSSYSSGSYSSRSRSSSSYSSRSSYSRSSSESSRSSSGSRSRSPPPIRRGPPPNIGPPKRQMLPKPNEAPRSFVAKAGHIAAMNVSRRNSSDPDRRSPALKPPSQKQMLPQKQAPPQKQPLPQKQMLPQKQPMARAGGRPGEPPGGRQTQGAPLKQPLLPKPSSQPVIPTKLPVIPKKATSMDKPFRSDTRPGRSLRRRTKSRSSSSSRSRSFSSSGSSSRSRSRSSSVSSSSSSSSRSADSDNLYGDMASPTRSKGSRSPSPKKRMKGSQPATGKASRTISQKGPPPMSKDVRQHRAENTRGRHMAEPTWKRDEKSKSTLMTAQPAVHAAKDPLKLQGQKSSIKLTLKSSKVGDSSVAKKRPVEDAQGSQGPPSKKPVKSPVKEPKEPVRITLSKSDKLIRPVKEVGSNTSSRSSSSQAAAPKPAPKPSQAPSKPPPAEPVPVPAPAPAPALAPAPGKKKSTSSRREELLKQLKAVEDAIARKRQK